MQEARICLVLLSTQQDSFHSLSTAATVLVNTVSPDFKVLCLSKLLSYTTDLGSGDISFQRMHAFREFNTKEGPTLSNVCITLNASSGPWAVWCHLPCSRVSGIWIWNGACVSLTSSSMYQMSASWMHWRQLSTRFSISWEQHTKTWELSTNQSVQTGFEECQVECNFKSSVLLEGFRECMNSGPSVSACLMFQVLVESCSTDQLGGHTSVSQLPKSAGGGEAGRTPLLHFIYKSNPRSQFIMPAWTGALTHSDFQAVRPRSIPKLRLQAFAS